MTHHCVTDDQYGQLWRRLEEVARRVDEGTIPFDSTADVYYMTVDYDRSVEDGVKAGNYDWSSEIITSENFPTSRSGRASIYIELVHFDRDISTEQALKELDRGGLRPTELHELLAFGEKYPDVQCEFLVIALGSVWRGPDGDHAVPYLSLDGSERGLSLSWFEDDWGDGCRFAAVRK